MPSLKILPPLLSALAFAPFAGAVGLTQVHEAQPYMMRDETPYDSLSDIGIMALDLLFGSNYVGFYGPMDAKDGQGAYHAINWVNNGDFHVTHFGEDNSWNFTAALVQRGTWISSRGGSINSKPGLNSIWFDVMLMHHEKDSAWSEAVVLSPGVSSDFDNFDHRIFRLPVQASARYQVSPTLAFELGLAYTPDFVRSPLLPILGVTWTPAEDWLIEARFTTFTATYRLASKTTIGAFASCDEASWMVGGENNFEELSFGTATAGVEFTQGFDITDKTPAVLSFAVGGTFANSLRLYDPNGDDLRSSVRMDGGLFLRGGLRIDF